MWLNIIFLAFNQNYLSHPQFLYFNFHFYSIKIKILKKIIKKIIRKILKEIIKEIIKKKYIIIKNYKKKVQIDLIIIIILKSRMQ